MSFFSRWFGGKKKRASAAVSATVSPPVVSPAPPPPPPPPPPGPVSPPSTPPVRAPAVARPAAIEAVLAAQVLKADPPQPEANQGDDAAVIVEEVGGIGTPVRIIMSDGSAATLPEDDELHARLKYLADNLIPPKDEPGDT